MKKIILASLLTLAVSASAFAAGGPGSSSVSAPVKLMATVDTIKIATNDGSVTCTAPSRQNSQSDWVCKNSSDCAITVTSLTITGGDSNRHGYTTTCTHSTSTKVKGFTCADARATAAE